MSDGDGPAVRPFAAVLQELGQGSCHQELSEALQEVVAAALEHGKVGKVTLTLTVEPAKDGRSVFIADKIDERVPEGARPTTLFFTDGRGNVSRRDPRQPELPVRDATKAAQNDSREEASS